MSSHALYLNGYVSRRLALSAAVSYEICGYRVSDQPL